MRCNRIYKYFRFNDKETAERFVCLYGGWIKPDEVFGKGIVGYSVLMRKQTRKETDEIAKILGMEGSNHCGYVEYRYA